MSGTYGLEPKARLSDRDECVDVKALVPGDPDQMRIVADRFRRVGKGAGRVMELLQRVDAGDWVGDSADAFRSLAVHTQVPFATTAEVMLAVAASLEDLADTIDAARVVARRSGQLIGEAQAVSAGWQLTRIGPDPGEPTRDHAHRTLTAAQQVVDSTAQRTVQVLRDGRAQAPDGHEWRSFAEGFTDSVAQSAALAASLSPHLWYTDPERARENYAAFASSLAAPVLHPGDTASQLWQQLEEDPNHFFGSLLPGLILPGPTGPGMLFRPRLLRNEPDPGLSLSESSDPTLLVTPEAEFPVPRTAEPLQRNPNELSLRRPFPESLSMRDLLPGQKQGPLPPGPLTREQQDWLDDEATAVVDGHAWGDHYETGQIWWVYSREELIAYVKSVIRSPDDYHEALRGRMFFWDERYKTIVTIDMHSEGTVFPPRAGKARYDSWVAADVAERAANNE